MTAGALTLVLLCLMTALFAPVMAPYPYAEQNLLARLEGPSTAHWFGTDDLGRDTLSRIIWGARVSIVVSFGAVAIGVTTATLIGLYGGFYGGLVDLGLQRIVDFVMAMPAIILLLVVVSMIGQSVLNLTLALAIVQIGFASRIARGTTIQISASAYVEAARVIGASDRRIIFRHILPGLFPPMIVVVSISMGVMILAESSLSFLGYGVVPPTPSWGGMLSGSARTYMLANPWMSIWPGLAITVVVFAFNMLGDGLRDILDPRLR